ncbi:MAG TPA: alpha-L-fucosidase [Polyangia bacterium]|nr:alpha-L-fucosidase [Polyangia bacterium]
MRGAEGGIEGGEGDGEGEGGEGEGAVPIWPAGERTPTLAAWEGLGFGLFIHFGMSTFTGRDYDEGRAPASLYAPTALDVRQWVRTARRAGMRYAVLTAKHMNGFCLWPSAGSDYGVATGGDQTDVVGAFAAACREEGIAPGIYYCILDARNERPGHRVDWQAPLSPAYWALVGRQLRELHERYGPRGAAWAVQWIDVPGKLSLEQRQALYALVKSLSPDCLVLMNHGFCDGTRVRLSCFPTDLVNGERVPPPEGTGHAPRKCVPADFVPGTAAPAVWDEFVEGMRGRCFYVPMEFSETVGQAWFGLEDDPPKTVRTLYRLYREARERGANLLLDVGPDRMGRIPQEVVERLLELGRVIDDPARLPPPASLTCAGQVTASNVFGQRPEYQPRHAVDEDPTTRWATDTGTSTAWLEVDLGAAATFDEVRLREPLGPRVRRFQVERLEEEGWRPFLVGTTIGEELRASFAPVTARRVRLHIFDAAARTPTPRNVYSTPEAAREEGPTIAAFELYAAERRKGG